MISAARDSLPLPVDAAQQQRSDDCVPAPPPEPPAPAPGRFQALLHKARHLLAEGSLVRAIVHGFMTVAALTLVAKAVSFFKDAAVGQRFGVSDALDAFGIAFGVHTFTCSLIGGSLPAAFLPAYAALKHQRGARRAERLGVQTAITQFAFLAFAALVISLAGPWLVHVLGHGFPPEKQALSLHIMRGLVPFLLCFGMTLHLGTWLQGNKLFAVAAATPILTPAAILLSVFVTPSDAPVTILVWGTNIGAFAHFVILSYVLGKRCPLSWRWLRSCIRLIEPSNRNVLRTAGPYLMAGFVICGSPMIDQAMSAQLSSGSVSVLQYSDKICGILLALTATAAADTMFPFFADAVAKRDWPGLKRQIFETTRVILYLALPLVALLCWQAPLVVKLLFERGKFTPEHTLRVAEVLRCAALQIPFYITSLIMSKVVVTLRGNWFTLASSVVSLITNVILNAVLMRYYGVAGIALSTVCVYALSCTLLTVYLLRAIRRLSREDQPQPHTPA